MHMKATSDNRKLIAGRDINIPGSEMYDTLENLGIEEEEYNFYSPGADGHSNQEEDAEEKMSFNYHWYTMTQKVNHRKRSDKN